MRFRPAPTFTALLLVTCAAAARAQEQQKDQQVIEEFVTTRGVSFEEPGKRPQKKAATPAPPRRNNPAAGKSPAPGGGVASGKKPGGKSPTAGNSNKGGAARPAGGSDLAAQADGQDVGDAGAQTLKVSAAAGAPRPLALGYTILMKDEAGRLSVVDASREFKTGDNIAIALETNADGYLYMFNASDGRNPEMLFPNVQLDGGANSLAAHARATFPADPSLDFRFTDPPAREHLFVVFSREPLEGVPTGDALAEFCGNNRDDCAWKPPAPLWDRIRRGGGRQGITEVKNVQLAQGPAPPVMPGTLQRGLKVKRNDPKPAVVRVNNSPDADVLVTEIVLAHR